jgi:hypothetical protein
MKSLRLLLPILAAALIAPPVAAGGYIAVGIGPDALLTGSLDDRFDAESTGSGRLAAGVRHGPLALEGSLFGAASAGLLGASEPQSRGDFRPISVGVDAKYHVRLAPLLEAYARAGVSRTVVRGPELFTVTHAGSGRALGAGLQIPLRPPGGPVQMALWADYTRHTLRLENGGPSEPVEGRAHLMMAGFALGRGM